MEQALETFSTMFILAGLAFVLTSKTLTRGHMMCDIAMPPELLRRFVQARDGIILAMLGAGLNVILDIIHESTIMMSVHLILIGLLYYVMDMWQKRITQLENMINF